MSGSSGGRGPTLTKLVQQIADIVAAGDDSSASQSQGSDAGLRTRLRSVLLTLLEQVVEQQGEGRGGGARKLALRLQCGDGGGSASTALAPPASTAHRPGAVKEVGSVMKLLSLTLARVPHMLVGEGPGTLLELVERLLPALARPALAGAAPEIVGAARRLLTLLHELQPAAAAALEGLARGLLLMVQGEGGRLGGGGGGRAAWHLFRGPTPILSPHLLPLPPPPLPPQTRSPRPPRWAPPPPAPPPR